jgi:hypothetical protein
MAYILAVFAYEWSRYVKTTGGSVTRFFASGFFHESCSPKPLKMTFQILQVKVHQKFAAGVNYTDGKLLTTGTTSDC